MLDLTFGEQVKIILKRKGMTIKELAKLIEEQTGKKMSRQNMTQRLNRDNFQEQDMRAIASILGCPFQLNILGEDTTAENDSVEHIQEMAAEPTEEIVEEVYEEGPEEEVVEEVYEEEPMEEEIVEEIYEEPVEENTEEVYEETYEEPAEEVYEEPTEEYDDFRETEELIRETFEEENQEEVSEVTTGESEETALEAEETVTETEEPAAKPEEPVKKKKHHSWKDYFQRMTGKHADKEADDAKQPEVEEQQQGQNTEQEPEESELTEEYKEELSEEFTEPDQAVPLVEEQFAEAFEEAVAKESEPVEEETEDLSIGEMNPYTGREYESNSVRMHPKRIGYVQVYSRRDHKWQDMTEWAFLGEQERKKLELGDDYVSPIYLD